jgi:preprotein translocase subunit SecB
MTETPETPEGEGQQAQPQQQMKMHILGQFIRDMSFENFVVRKGVSGEMSPDIQVQVALDAKKRQAENQYEVIAKFTIDSKNKGDQAPLFLLELEYGTLFHIENVPEDQLHPFLLIECPRMMFPFVRRIVSDVTRDGGFPPLNLEVIDFVQLYRQQILARAEAQKEKQPTN